MSNIKVTYFNLSGLAEPMRWLLKYGNIDFEDVRVEKEDWPALKPSTPFGQMPLYEENGKVAYQSLAIDRYLAKKVKLTGANEWEDLEIDAVADTIMDFTLKIAKAIYADEQDKAKLLSELKSQTMPYYLEKFDKRVVENDGYLAVNKLTWVDFLFVSVLEYLQDRLGGEDILQDYKNLSALRQKIYDIPVIKEWRKVRPVTDYKKFFE